MMIEKVIVDSSIWIDFFKRGIHTDKIRDISENTILCVNDIVLTEVVPGLLHFKETKAASYLKNQYYLPLSIEKDELIKLQLKMIKAGINKVGVADLIILQNALQNSAVIASIDKHFKLMCPVVGVKIFE